MTTLKCCALAGLSLGIAASASAALITFDDQSVGTLITTQYPEVIFSSEAGASNYAIGYGGGNILCTGLTGGAIDCIRDTYIEFDDPANNLEFDAVEANFAGVSARFRIFHSGGTTVEDFTSLGASGYQHVDLSAYTGVTGLEIFDILDDVVLENGIGWDNFEFDVVPEPASMLGLAAAVGILVRRRRK